ncbi:ATP-binding protein [Natronomonas halophila]|uniref:sensor histidine kinase n=1 Tax=Natronomonas halophila TaxID=2747817 RepID=UPI0015B5D207|nr:HAMP domain-containing sensor histidine kinase [Natronomonas halophila]QLD87213.1 ATP-binding protein [Natronomonas halophila]
MATPGSRKRWGALFVTLGVTLAAAGLTFWFAWGLPNAGTYNQVVLGIVVNVLFGYIVVMSGVTIYRSDLAVSECLVAAKWCAGGFLFMASFVVWAAAPEIQAGGISLAFANQFVVVGSVGAAAGVLIGLNRGQAAQNARLVEDTRDQRETLRFLLRLIRHDIKNDLVVIAGFADRLEGRFDADPEELDRIQERADSAQRLLETADTIIESETGQLTTEPVDLSAILREQLSVVRTSYPALTVETDIEDDLQVDASELIDEVFWNVLENAAEHNDPSTLTVSVTAERVDDAVEITIADDGTGIPDPIHEDVFEPAVRRSESEGDGLGLYLVRKLVETCDGTVAVEDADPSGTVFRIRLPAV